MQRLGAVRKFHARGHQYHILARSGHGQFIIAVVGVGTSPPNSANVLDGWLASQTRHVVHVKLRCVETRFSSICRRRMQRPSCAIRELGDQMGANNPSKAFGRIFAPREDWLAQAQPEEILEPELAIIDSHHHLWETPGRYLLEDYLADAGTGHNVVATVVIESGSHQRTKGPVEFRPVGEVA